MNKQRGAVVTGSAILIAALTGVLTIGARTAGTLVGTGVVKIAHAIKHHEVAKTAKKAAKAFAKHQVK